VSRLRQAVDVCEALARSLAATEVDITGIEEVQQDDSAPMDLHGLGRPWKAITQFRANYGVQRSSDRSDGMKSR
jgi:hypothetical protein